MKVNCYDLMQNIDHNAVVSLMSLQIEFVPFASLWGRLAAGVVAWVESLPLATLGDFVRGRISESERQVDRLFESLLAEVFHE